MRLIGEFSFLVSWEFFPSSELNWEINKRAKMPRRRVPARQPQADVVHRVLRRRRGQPQPPAAALGAPPPPPPVPLVPVPNLPVDVPQPPVPQPPVPQPPVPQPPLPQHPVPQHPGPQPPVPQLPQLAQPPVEQGEGIAVNNVVLPHADQGIDFNNLVNVNERNVQHGEAYRPQGVKQLGAPLGKFVDVGLKVKIWRGEFIDLPLLLSNTGSGGATQPLSLFNIDGQLCLKSQAVKPKEIYNIEKWTAAFFVFMSIYLQQHPQRAIELIKYTDLIRNLAQRFPGTGWVMYDKEFRLEQAIDPSRSWAHYDSDLFLEKLAMPVFAIQQQSGRRGGAPWDNSQVTQGRVNNSQYCFDFNKGNCRRRNCFYPHKCSICLRLGHNKLSCTAGQNNQAMSNASRPHGQNVAAVNRADTKPVGTFRK